MRPALVLLLMVLATASLPAAPNAEEQAMIDSLLHQARQEQKGGKLSHARTFCHAVIFLDPANMEAFQLLRTLPSFSESRTDGVAFEKFRGFPSTNKAMEMQMLRFRSVASGELLPALNPQLGRQR
ncbi:MAG: hypothetical protein ACOYMS_04785 [Terrimicrobiaceae bacterium]